MATDRSVESYYEDVKDVELLTAEREQRLFAQYHTCSKCQHAYTGDAKEVRCPACGTARNLYAREKIVEGALRFVVKVAREYARRAKGERHGEESLLTLISAGNLGLLVAVDRFEVSRGTRFLTYAAWWIREKILEELDNMSVIRVPAYQQKAQRARWKASGNTDNDPPHVTLEPIEDTDPFPVEEPTDLLSQYSQPVLQAAVKDARLNTYEQYVVSLSLGLREDPRNLKQIAARIGATPEKVRGLRRSALDEVRRSLRRNDVYELTDVI